MSTETNQFTPIHNQYSWSVPNLANGDRLDREEFMRRYEAIPDFDQAELVEGVVLMASPVSAKSHAQPHSKMMTLMGIYEANTKGCVSADNATIQLDNNNAPQPDCFLRVEDEYGGQARLKDRYVSGAPELIAEIASSSVSNDLHDKKQAYQRNGVLEYVVWRVNDEAIDWFVLKDGKYKPAKPDEKGIYKSQVFPGLWINSASLIGDDLKQAIDCLNEGIASKEHVAFVKKLEQAKTN